jgi:hypothetical protein
MLLNLTGSSCSGKSTLALAISEHVTPDVVVADFDQSSVPDDPEPDWRLVGTERWIRQALEPQERGRHLLLIGQTPLGELLASPTAPMLDGIANCLIDVADGERLRRLDARDPGRWSPQEREDFVRWGRWHRGHAADPNWAPEVIVRSCSVLQMEWGRWTGWKAGDPRWTTTIIDTTDISLPEAAAELTRWVRRQIDELARGTLPLRRGWTDLVT